MPPFRGHGIVYAVAEDDNEHDLHHEISSTYHPIQHSKKSIDQPYVFTFMPDMTPMSPTAMNHPPIVTFHSNIVHEPLSLMITSTPPDSPLSPTESILHAAPRGSHGKKRDASYIPRPPNAFILFRSSFIRDQQVPGKVEGNHSTLSKIIGMYWKTLPKEERQKWEEKAVIAQAEHRKRYPDWRFRPGSNAIAKLKIKDEGCGSSRKRSSRRAKAVEGAAVGHSEGGPKERGKAKAKVKDKMIEEDRRCAKIADLLKSGKKGSELEAAIREWEGKEQLRASDATSDMALEPARLSPEGSLSSEVHATRTHDPAHTSVSGLTSATITESPYSPTFPSPQSSPSQVAQRQPELSSNVPLTAMYRRPQTVSAQEPKTYDQPTSPILSSPDQSHFSPHAHIRRESISFPTSSAYHQERLFQPGYQRVSGYEKRSSVDTRWPDVEAMRCDFDPHVAIPELPDSHIVNVESGGSQTASYPVEWRNDQHLSGSAALSPHSEAPTTAGISTNSALFASVALGVCPAQQSTPLLSEGFYYQGMPASSFSTLTDWAGGNPITFVQDANSRVDDDAGVHEDLKQTLWQFSKRTPPIGLEGEPCAVEEGNRELHLSASALRASKLVSPNSLQPAPPHYSTSADHLTSDLHVNTYHHQSPASPHTHYFGQHHSFN
ncbi:hypothetical protein AX16_002562 [Volvariella volvacea WC 439]|nr:hypothetical protein AX16_002562 [Volvariella volvacea WC 439]